MLGGSVGTPTGAIRLDRFDRSPADLFARIEAKDLELESK
jgi:hypothetical protein